MNKDSLFLNYGQLVLSSHSNSCKFPQFPRFHASSFSPFGDRHVTSPVLVLCVS